MQRKFIPVAFLFCYTFPCFGQSYYDFIAKASDAYLNTDYKKSMLLYLEAFKLDKSRANDLYNGACSAALANEITISFEMLDLSVQHGWSDTIHLKEDGDLQILHKNKNWENLLLTIHDKIANSESKYDKHLQKELLAIFEDDQGLRLKFIDSSAKYGPQNPIVIALENEITYQDSINTLRVSKILDERGWVGPEIVGNKANETIFLVIQHGSLKTQQKYLPLMREAVKIGNANNSSLALLEDRVALREGRKQIYGSQIYTNPRINVMYVAPLEDPEHVDQRRAEMGLGPLSYYVKKWSIVWDPETYNKHLPLIEKWSKGDY